MSKNPELLREKVTNLWDEVDGESSHSVHGEEGSSKGNRKGEYSVDGAATQSSGHHEHRRLHAEFWKPLRRFHHVCHHFVKSRMYSMLMNGIVLSAAGLELYVLQTQSNPGYSSQHVPSHFFYEANLALQAFFSLDILLVFFASNEKPFDLKCWLDQWFQFDVVVVGLLWAPVIAPNNNNKFLGMFEMSLHLL